ncbi:MAG: hypothetical protein H6704_07195 [Myxococcales bacterium]|nr:hypothetical protein [Myxococcales bacterium]MCB9536036.1 hypothetical protein [Myxococcales bacterium]
MKQRTFTLSTALAAPADIVWWRVTTPAGINDELAPWLRMTVPAPMVGRTLADVPVGSPLGRSWLLLFGVLPVEYDAITLARVEPLGFVEASSMLSMRAWGHARSVTPTPTGCTVTDRLTWTPRLPGLGALSSMIVAALFRHRHARLRRAFGEGTAG